MTLSVRTHKVRKKDRQPVYKIHRFACFDTICAGKTFEEKYNEAFNTLKEEIEQERDNNDMNLYEPIVIADVWLS